MRKIVSIGVHTPDVSIILPEKDASSLLEILSKGVIFRPEYTNFDDYLIPNGSEQSVRLSIRDETIEGDAIKVYKLFPSHEKRQLCEALWNNHVEKAKIPFKFLGESNE